jgi:PKHD-type hydroxylase
VKGFEMIDIKYGLGSEKNTDVMPIHQEKLSKNGYNTKGVTHYYDENFLSKEKVDEINYKLFTLEPTLDKKKGSLIGENYNNIDRIHFTISRFDKKDDIYFADEIIEKSLNINQKYFNLDLDSLFRFNLLRYTGQDKNHIDWHMDEHFGYDIPDNSSITESTKFRKLTTVLMLSSHEEYEGGEFLFYDFSTAPDNYPICSFKMDKGEAIIFPSFALHKVNPVTSGKRNSLVAWFSGPRWR